MIFGSLLAVQGGWIQAKAWLAQQLLSAAWSETLRDGLNHRPWPWADHFPVARLTAAAYHKNFIVLQGDSGNVLAFAPGHNMASGMPEEHRTIIISGHRDTHFRFLRDVKPGERMTLETTHGQFEYRMLGAQILDARAGGIAIHSGDDRLVLVTCWPFDAVVPGGPMRYVVTLEKIINS